MENTPRRCASRPDPVVGIAHAISQHEGESLRCQSGLQRNQVTNFEKFVIDDELQDIVFAPSLEECEVYQPAGGKMVKCDLPAETVCRLKNHRARVRVCDLCFTEKVWFLMVLSMIVPGANSLEIKLVLDSAEMVGLYTTIAVTSLVWLLTVYLIVRRIFTSVDRCLPIVCTATVNSVHEVTSSWRYMANVKALGKVTSHLFALFSPAYQRAAPIVQGFSHETGKLFRTISCVIAGFLMLCTFFVRNKQASKRLLEEYKVWKERAAASKYVVTFLKFLEDALSGIWAPASDLKEDAADAKETVDRSALDRNLSKLSKVSTLVSSFDKVISLLRIEDQTEYLMRVVRAETAEDAILALRQYKLSDEVFIELSKHYEAAQEESFEPWPERAGIGLIPGVGNEPHWLMNSHLMKAAVRMQLTKKNPALLGSQERNIDSETFMVFTSMLKDWHDHCRSCDSFPHKGCHRIEWEGSLEAKAYLQNIQDSLGALAWPSVVVSGRAVSLKEFYAQKRNGFKEEKEILIAPTSAVEIGHVNPISVEGEEEVNKGQVMKCQLWEKFIGDFPKEVQEELRDETYLNLFELKAFEVTLRLEELLKAHGVYTTAKVTEFKAAWMAYADEKKLNPEWNSWLLDSDIERNTRLEEKLEQIEAAVLAKAELKGTTYRERLGNMLEDLTGSMRRKCCEAQTSKDVLFEKLGSYVRKLYLFFGNRPSLNSADSKFSTKSGVISPDARQEWEDDDELASDLRESTVVYYKTSTDLKIATLTDRALGKASAIFAGTIFVVTVLAHAFVKMRSEQAYGWQLQAKGDNKRRNKERYELDEDWALTEKEVKEQTEHAYNEYISKWEAMDSDYHRQGVMPSVVLQGAIHPHTKEKIQFPVRGPRLQGVTSCDNLADIQGRVFSVFSEEECKNYLINAFLVGKILFCQSHSVNGDVWLVSSFGEKFYINKRQWKPYGKSDLIYLIWNSVVRKGNKVSLAEPKVGMAVQMVSSRLRGSAKSGVIVMKGTNYSWATYESALGDCGAPVVNNQGLVVGFHQLGSQYANGFISVDSEMIEFVKRNGEALLQTSLEVQGFKYQPDGRVFKPCIKNKKLCSHFSQFAIPRGLPKRIGNHWLADFNPGDLEAGLRRYDTPDVIVDSEAIDWATQQLYKMLKLHVGTTVKKSIDEIHPLINQNSGPGYPFVLNYSKKKQMLDEDPNYYLKFNQRPDEVWWWAKLKCEIREIGKMARTYVASNVHFTYFANQFFLDFNQKFTEAGARQQGFFSTVGIAVQYAGWNRLYDRLRRHVNILEGDGKRYDTRVLAEFLWRVCWVRTMLFEPQSSQDLKDIVWCYHQFIYSKIKTPEGFECFKVKGQPSGGNNTIVDNTCVLFMMYMVCWYNLVGPEVDWQKFLELALNGDDSLVTVHDEVKEKFHPSAVAAEFAKMGMQYEIACGGWNTWQTASYLSRYFHTTMGGIVVPVFDFSKLYSSLHFSKKPNDYAYSLVRCNGILAEMFTDKNARALLRDYQNWLISRVREHPGSEFEEPALCGVQTDFELHMLYVTTPLQLQGFPGIEESATPGKRNFQMQNNNQNQSQNQMVKETTIKRVSQRRRKSKKPKNEKKITVIKTLPRPRSNRKQKKMGRKDKRAAELAYAIANPLDSSNVRVATSYGSVPTGVATLQERIATFPPADGYTQTTVANCYVFRSALRSCVFGMPWPGTQVVYEAFDPSFELPLTEFNHFGQPLNAATNTVRHGPVLWPGKYGHDAKEYGYLMNNEDTVTITVGSWPTGLVAFNVQAYVYTAKGFVPTVKGTIASGGPAFTYTYTSVPNNIPTYVAFGLGFTTGVAVPASVPVTLQLTTGNPSSHASSSLYYCQHALPQINEQIPSVEDVRMIGASLMWTNTSPNITKQGQAAIAQLSATADFEDYLTYESLSSINPLISCVKKAEDGIYGFLKPTHTNDFKFLGEWESATGGITDPLDSYIDGVEEAYFQIDSQYDSLGCALSLPGNIGITQSGYWTVAYKIEYRSDDQWRSLAIGNKNDEVVDAALAAISQMPQFHSNAFHISDITNWLSEKLKYGKELIETHGPTMVKSLETVIGGLSLLATVL